MKKLLAILKLSRWTNLIIVVATFLLSNHFLGFRSFSFFDALALSFVSALSAAAANVINDIIDQPIDIINKPERVVVGKHLSVRFSYGLYFFLVVSSCIIPHFFLEPELALIAVYVNILQYLYSKYWKAAYLIGNVLVSLLSSSVIFLPHFFLGQLDDYNVIVISAFAFTVSVVREMIKDAEDLKGDKELGLKTFAIVSGVERVKQVSLFLLFIIVMYAWPYGVSLGVFEDTFSWSQVYWFGLVVPFVLYIMFKITRAQNETDFAKVSKLCKVLMFLGILLIVIV